MKNIGNKFKVCLKNPWAFFLIISIAFLLLFPCFKIIFNDHSHIHEAIYRFDKIDILRAEADQTTIKPAYLTENIYDDSRNTVWAGPVGEKTTNRVTIQFKEITKVNKILINFGDGSIARDFDLRAYVDGQWVQFDSVKNNNKSYYLRYFHDTDNITTDKIQIKLIKTADGDLQKIADVFVYTTSGKNNPLIAGFNLLFNHQRSVLAYFFYTIVILFMIISSGALVVKPIEKYFNSEEMPIIKFVGGVLFFGFVGTVLMFLPPIHHLQAFAIVFFTGWIILCIRFGSFKNIINKNLIYFITILFGIFLVFWFAIFDQTLQGRLLSQQDPYFDKTKSYDIQPWPYLSDQVVPNGIAKIFYYHEPVAIRTGDRGGLITTSYIGDRTQLFPLINLPFKALFGDNFIIFEVVGIVLSLFAIPSVFLLIKKLFTEKIAYITIFFLILNHYLIYVTTLAQTKYIALLFVVMFLYYLVDYKQKKNDLALWMAGIMITIAILLHNFAIIYVAVGAFYLLPNPLRWLKEKMVLLKAFSLPVATFASWLYYNMVIHKSSLVTSISVGSVNLPFKQNLIENLLNRFLNFISLFIVYPTKEIPKNTGYPYETLIGSLTIALIIFIVWGIVANYKNKKLEINCFLLLSLFLIILANGIYTNSGIHLYFVPVIPLAIAFGAEKISHLSKKIQFVIYVAAIVEWIFVSFVFYYQETTRWLYSYFLNNPFKGSLVFLLFFAIACAPMYVALRKILNKQVKFFNYQF